MKVKPTQAAPPDALHVALSLLSAVATPALRHSQPDDQFVRDNGFFAAINAVEKTLSALTWPSVWPGSTIRIFPALASCIAVVMRLLQLRCGDVAIALLPPTLDAAAQAMAQTREYQSLYDRCMHVLKMVSQSVLDGADDAPISKTDVKRGSGALEDEGLAVAMCCAYAAAAADAAAAALRASAAAARGSVAGGDDGDESVDDHDDGSEELSDGDGGDMCDVSPAVRL
jgi:hypothetical protein